MKKTMPEDIPLFLWHGLCVMSGDLQMKYGICYGTAADDSDIVRSRQAV